MNTWVIQPWESSSIKASACQLCEHLRTRGSGGASWERMCAHPEHPRVSCAWARRDGEACGPAGALFLGLSPDGVPSETARRKRPIDPGYIGDTACDRCSRLRGATADPLHRRCWQDAEKRYVWLPEARRVGGPCGPEGKAWARAMVTAAPKPARKK